MASSEVDAAACMALLLSVADGDKAASILDIQKSRMIPGNSAIRRKGAEDIIIVINLRWLLSAIGRVNAGYGYLPRGRRR